MLICFTFYVAWWCPDHRHSHIYPVFILDGSTFEPLIELRGVFDPIFRFEKTIQGRAFIQLFQNGILQVYIYSDGKAIKGYRYDIRNGEAKLIPDNE